MKSFKSYRKGQAALEFLTTYGWAFLVILVAIGGLSYFGVFDIGRLLPEGCKLDTNLECGDVYVVTAAPAGNAALQLQIKNNRDKIITINSISLLEKGMKENAVPHACVGNAVVNAPYVTTINPGKIADVEFPVVAYGPGSSDDCGLGINVGNKKTFIMDVSYQVDGSNILMVSSGEITTTVQ